MARVSMRVGWGRRSPVGLTIAAIDGVVALALLDQPGVAILVACFVPIALFFAFVHPDRVVAIDDDDGPEVRVGDRVDD